MPDKRLKLTHEQRSDLYTRFIGRKTTGETIKEIAGCFGITPKWATQIANDFAHDLQKRKK